VVGRTPGTVFAPGVGSFDQYSQDESTWALYANDSIAFTDRLEMTLGLRYTSEQKDLDTLYNNTSGGTGCTLIRQNLTALGTAIAVGGANPPAGVNTAAVLVGTGCSTANDPAFNN